MALASPQLDDRTFAQLVEAARSRILTTCPAWTDLSISDPGMALVEVFAFLTETMIYRLNRLPEKAYIEFLRLLGVQILPPEASSVALQFKSSRPAAKPIEIPRGTRVSVSRTESGSEPPVFVLARTAVIPVGTNEVESIAFHCDLVEGELLGTGNGLAGLSFTVNRPPVAVTARDELDLVVAVEATAAELGERVPARELGGKNYRIWREVSNFTQLGPDRLVYVADRASGTITFAPAVRMRDNSGLLGEAAQLLADVPAAGREVRAWYASGGGPQGNVAASTLTVLKDPIPGVTVNNASPAVGGRSVESVQNALLRGPQELHSLERAVTARDFELFATRSGAISRARAFTKAAVWSYAVPGTVEVVLVPFVDEQKRRRVSLADLLALHTEEARHRIQDALDERRPLGTLCAVRWAHYQVVEVHCHIVAHPQEDAFALKNRVLDRLYDLINPLPAKNYSGWRFGQALRTSNLYDALLSEPGVSYVDGLHLTVEDVPEKNIECLAIDAFQPDTWYAGTGTTLYRTMDNGTGWTFTARFPDQTAKCVETHPLVPGLVAVAAQNSSGGVAFRVHVSYDCGETWDQKALLSYAILDMAWSSRDGTPLLFMATEKGLFELLMQADASATQVFVRPDDQQIGYHAVEVANLKSGGVRVIVACRNSGGIFFSGDAGRAKTFRPIGLATEDIRVLAVQTDGERSYLWAGEATPKLGDPGKGCWMWPLVDDKNTDPAEGWQPFDKGWRGGSCTGIAFQKNKILAGSFDSGVLWFDQRDNQQSWNVPDMGCGLPLADRDHPLERIDALVADPRGSALMAGCKSGVFRSRDVGQHYENCSNTSFIDKVTLPPNWLFLSGEHDLIVTTEDEERTD